MLLRHTENKKKRYNTIFGIYLFFAIYGANVILCLDFGCRTLYKSRHFFPTTEDFHKIWNLYQDSKRIVDIMEEGFDNERSEFQAEIDELTEKCKNLKKRNKALRDSIKRLKDSSDSR
jgi:predicted nuclease with TOPRIM domain